jgi:hypothetical protein
MQKAAQFLFDCRCVALPNYADDRGIHPGNGSAFGVSWKGMKDLM